MSSVDKSSSLPQDNPSLLVGRNWIERLLVSFIANHTPEMPGSCKTLIAINGGEAANHDPDQTAVSFLYLCLVSPLRKAAPGIA
jgi:hypothetical protein